MVAYDCMRLHAIAVIASASGVLSPALSAADAKPVMTGLGLPDSHSLSGAGPSRCARSRRAHPRLRTIVPCCLHVGAWAFQERRGQDLSGTSPLPHVYIHVPSTPLTPRTRTRTRTRNACSTLPPGVITAASQLTQALLHWRVVHAQIHKRVVQAQLHGNVGSAGAFGGAGR